MVAIVSCVVDTRIIQGYKDAGLKESMQKKIMGGE
ncbi:hypothetical protein J2S17_003782 [Cytobacillus purgationiresistens]|uniref:Uncharacterized protein n=1 Tax=Cytobacillus purgationiresistens TaxID=863449 RepID=A0ABU0ALY8_9BACI|nr:hypothetical protein [Cytobacillus purgationiresistens]